MGRSRWEGAGTMTFLLIFGVSVISLVLQGSVMALVGTGGVHPDILFVVVVALALLSDSKRGALTGLSMGLLQDILFASPLGFFSFGKMLAGTLAGMLAHEIYREIVWAPMLIVAVLTMVNEAIVYLMMNLYFTPPITLLHYLRHFSLSRMIMHLLIMALIYPCLYRAQKRNLLFVESESDN